MRIPCPFCGTRDHAEFSHHGDAAPVRPVTHGRYPNDEALFVDYVYLRTNPAGAHRELWQHTGGCRSWLVVERNTATHAVGRATLARDARAQGEPA